MEREKDFDGRGFFDLLGEVMTRVRDGMPWAVSVQFDGAGDKAA